MSGAGTAGNHAYGRPYSRRRRQRADQVIHRGVRLRKHRRHILVPPRPECQPAAAPYRPVVCLVAGEVRLRRVRWGRALVFHGRVRWAGRPPIWPGGACRAALRPWGSGWGSFRLLWWPLPSPGRGDRSLRGRAVPMAADPPECSIATGEIMTAAVSPAGPGQPGWLDPELATLTRDRFSDPGWIFERKLDGERCLAFRSGRPVRLMTRTRKDDTPPTPSSLRRWRPAGRRFHHRRGDRGLRRRQDQVRRLQQRLGVRHPGADLLAAVPVCYYVFDVLSGRRGVMYARCRCGSASRCCAAC